MKNLNQKMKDFLSETLVSVLATLDQNGSPRTRANWHDWTEKEGLLLFTSSSSLKWLNILNDNRVSLCIDDPTPPYRSLVLDGIAVKIVGAKKLMQEMKMYLKIKCLTCQIFINLYKLQRITPKI